MAFRDQLVELGACKDAIKWVVDRNFVAAWAECERAA